MARKVTAAAAKASETVVTADAWRAWLHAEGISAAEAARRLGIATNTPTAIRERGAGLTVALAMAAVSAGLDPWAAERADELAAVRALMPAIRKSKA